LTSKMDGVLVPAATPFDSDGALRLDWFEHNVTKWSDTDVTGLMVLGTNGEFRSLSDDESRAVVALAAELTVDRTLIVGVGRESTVLTLAFIDSLAADGAAIDFVSVLPPHYFAKSMTSHAMLNYYTEVADGSPFPVLIYVAPAYSNGVVLTPATVAALADHPNIAGIKDTSNDQLTAYSIAAGGRPDFSVLSGSMSTVLTGLFLGGTGCVVSAANYFPDECSAVVRLALAGDRERAIAAYGELQGLIQQTGGMSGVASLKACMNILGYRGGVPRLPVQPLARQEEARLLDALIAAGKVSAV